MMWFSLVAVAMAAPEVAVVGLHLDSLDADAAEAAAERLAAALEDTGKVRALAPDDVAARIAGRQDLVLNQYAMGPGRELLKEGQFLYDRAETDAALPTLADAVAALTSGLAVSPDPRSLQDALVLTGLCQLASGNESAARSAFGTSLVLDPAWQLDPVKYPPSVVTIYEEVRAEINNQRQARLTVTLDGAVAGKVYVDGRLIGDAPQTGISLPAGEHQVVVRGADGTSAVSRVSLTPGGDRSLALNPTTRSVGASGTDDAGRSRQTRDLYQALGAYIDESTVLLAGTTADGKVTLQLYSPRAGTFSKALTADGGDDPVGTLADLAASLPGYLETNGTIATNRVSAQVVPLDVNDNAVLLRLLYAPPEPSEIAASNRPPWWLWAGIGGLAVATGGVTAAVLLSEPEPTPTTGTIEVAIP